jgi:DNA-binding CsgD family transcriptional regulator
MLGKPVRPVWFLEGLLPGNKTWVIPIDRSPFIIGRSDQCDVTLLDGSVSRKHAEISYRGEELHIRDLKSTNGTFVDSSRIKGELQLSDGCEIHFGEIKFSVTHKEQRSDHDIDGTEFLKSPNKKTSFVDYYYLSKREEETLYYLLQGKSTKVIAGEMCVSVGTAKNHVLNLFKKCDVHSRFELLALFNSFESSM